MTFRISDVQFNQAIEQLGRYVAIPSVSNPASPDYSMDRLTAAADFAHERLERLGFTVTRHQIEDSPPFLIGEKVHDITQNIFLLYAHYDVQPVEREKWSSDPFTMVEKNGRLYGRGASDDKAGIMAILTAIQTCQSLKIALPNIKVLFEGEEEYGSPHLSALLKKEAARLSANALIVLDGGNKNTNTGTITSFTRGIGMFDIEVSALKKPVHSGGGCLAPDPCQALAGLIHSLGQPEKIPGFMKGAQQLTDKEREILRKTTLSTEEYSKDSGLLPGVELRGDPKHSIYERIHSVPSLSVVNMTAGQKNGGNSIQDIARCSINVRTLAGQDPDQVIASVIQHIKSQPRPYNVQVEAKQTEEGSWAWQGNLTGEFTTAYLEAMGMHFQETATMPSGGALPLLKEFKDQFPRMEMIVPGVEDPDTNAHSFDESQDLGVFRKVIDSLVAFLEKTGR